MNFNKFTIKAQEAVQEAIRLAQARGQQVIEPEHLLAGILKVGENVTNFLFQKSGINGRQIEVLLDHQIASLPKVQGGEPYLSRTSNEVLSKAQDIANKNGDEYVSLEPIILALLTTVSELEACIGGKNDLCDALIEIVRGYSDNHFAWAKEIWDVSTIGYLMNPDWVPSKLVHSPLLTDDSRWAHDERRHLIRECYFCHRNPVFKD
ncbi:MAG: hypothetical protein IIX35_02815, partial [Paraprevotella sp.]|nr:hypothetical protein [Paraprevotella sp.]